LGGEGGCGGEGGGGGGGGGGDGSTPQACPAGCLTPKTYIFPAAAPFVSLRRGFVSARCRKTCPKQVGIRLMFLVNPRYHRIECDSCLTSRCRDPANLG